MSQATPRWQFGILQYGIIVLTVATAIIHLYLAFTLGMDLLFMANGIGYLGLLALLYLPISSVASYRGLVRWVLLVYTAVTVVAWLRIGAGSPLNPNSSGPSLLAYVDKLIEIVLIVLLVIEWQRSRT